MGVGCEDYHLVFEEDICYVADCFRGNIEEIWQVDSSHGEDHVCVD